MINQLLAQVILGTLEFLGFCVVFTKYVDFVNKMCKKYNMRSPFKNEKRRSQNKKVNHPFKNYDR